MTNIKVTQRQIDDLINSANVKVSTEFGKCTTVTMQLQNGFILTESSACVDPENYNQQLGKKLCYEHIENKLWELEGYALQKKEYERKLHACKPACERNAEVPASGNFGWALDRMRHGFAVRRKGWNGQGIFIKLQVPDEHSKMTFPYIYIDTTGLQSNNPDAPRSRVPWLASQTDMLAEDWVMAE